MLKGSLASLLLFVGSSTAFATIKKPVFSVFGENELFAEVTCDGFPEYDDGLTIKLPAQGSNEDFATTYPLSEKSGLDISATFKHAENTLTLTWWESGKDGVVAATYSGLDVVLKHGDVKLWCRLNDGNQISDK